MTARDIKNLLGPNAARAAIAAGWPRNRWDQAVFREAVLSDDKRNAIAAEVQAQAEDIASAAEQIRVEP